MNYSSETTLYESIIKFSRTRFRHPYPFNESKSIEGTLAGLLVAVLACAFFTDPITSIIGCTTGMIVEASPIPINDNLTIPIISSLASYAFCILLGS